MEPARLGSAGAAAVLAGALVSGPIAMAIVAVTHPQPAWTDASTFAHHYHAVQALPFFAGFFLVSGFIALQTSIHLAAPATEKPRTTMALVFTAIYASLVFLNYVIQTTFVPALVASYDDAHTMVLDAFTMANPRSLAWSLEMWGYGFLGVATWLVAATFRGSTAFTFRANGVMSILGALATAASPGWVMTPIGMTAFAAWNVLVVLMAALAWSSFRARTTQAMQRPAACVP